MVELHEPMRLLLIVDATPEALLAVAGRQPEVAELVVNAWVQLVSLRPGDRRRWRCSKAGDSCPTSPRRRCCRSSSARATGTCARASIVTPALVRSALPEAGGRARASRRVDTVAVAMRVSEPDAAALALTILAPLASVVGRRVAASLLGGRASLRVDALPRSSAPAWSASVLGGLVVARRLSRACSGAPVRGDVEFGDWLRIGDFVIPAVLLVDGISVTISLFCARS